MNGLKYMYELFEKIPRCGPGDDASTRRAFNALSDLPEKQDILDIGCGTGMQTLELARISNGNIIALDNHQPFLNIMMARARLEKIDNRITPKNQSMLEMDFPDEMFDIIWSEGALYVMGFENGIKRCRELLKNRGYMAVTEAVYLRTKLPKALCEFWENEYPGIAQIYDKINIIKNQGFELLLNFTLPRSAWLDDFYLPMEDILTLLEKKHAGNQTALNIFASSRKEIEMYKTYSDYYGYEFFVMQK